MFNIRWPGPRETGELREFTSLTACGLIDAIIRRTMVVKVNKQPSLEKYHCAKYMRVHMLGIHCVLRNVNSLHICRRIGLA